MKVCWHWYGGDNYAAPCPEDAPEQFSSIKDALREFESRQDDDYYPCQEGPYAWVFRGTKAGDYPDWVIELGPRGGIALSKA